MGFNQVLFVAGMAIACVIIYVEAEVPVGKCLDWNFLIITR